MTIARLLLFLLPIVSISLPYVEEANAEQNYSLFAKKKKKKKKKKKRHHSQNQIKNENVQV